MDSYGQASPSQLQLFWPLIRYVTLGEFDSTENPTQLESGITLIEQQWIKKVDKDGEKLLGGFRLLKLSQFHHVTAHYWESV